MNAESDLAKEVCGSIEKCFSELTESIKKQSETITELIESVATLKEDNKALVERINQIQDDVYTDTKGCLNTSEISPVTPQNSCLFPTLDIHKITKN